MNRTLVFQIMHKMQDKANFLFFCKRNKRISFCKRGNDFAIFADNLKSVTSRERSVAMKLLCVLLVSSRQSSIAFYINQSECREFLSSFRQPIRLQVIFAWSSNIIRQLMLRVSCQIMLIQNTSKTIWFSWALWQSELPSLSCPPHPLATFLWKQSWPSCVGDFCSFLCARLCASVVPAMS